MSVSLKKVLHQKWIFLNAFAPVLHSLLISIIAFNTSSLQSTYPHASAAELRFQSHFPQLSQGILTCMLSPHWQQCKKHVKSLLCLLILFILYVWNGDRVLQIWNSGIVFLAFSLFLYTSFDSQDRSRGLCEAWSQQLDKHDINSCGLQE